MRLPEEAPQLFRTLESKETRVSIRRYLEDQLGQLSGLKCSEELHIRSRTVFHHYLNPLVVSSDHHLSEELIASLGQLNHLIALISYT